MQSPIYTPIRRTQLYLTDKKNLPLKIDEVPEIPIEGSTLGVKISTPFGPEIGLNIEIILNIDNQYVYLNTTEVNFNPGETENYFEIFADKNSKFESKQGSLEFILKGSNQDSYILSTKKLQISLGLKDE